MNKKNLTTAKTFIIPLIVLFGLVIFLILQSVHLQRFATIIVLATITIGSFGLFKESFEEIIANQFGLDYIAILAIIVSLVTHEFLVGSVIALMLATGRTLEAYGANQAKKSLSMLADRIPSDVLVELKDKATEKIPIDMVKIGDTIIVRRGEVIPLDGELLSEEGIVDESTLTGEPYSIEKINNDIIRSGTINIGNVIRILVTREEKNSTYKKIINMVEQAEKEKAPMVRLADQYSVIFTVITFIIAAFAFFYSHSLEAILAVLVVATPCPLILATPIALLGGVNAAAKKRIIIKKLASIEVLSRITAIVFDKTGTITLGKPEVTDFKINNHKPITISQLFGIALAIERNSLHPLAKAIVEYAMRKKAPVLHATHVSETIGKGISGVIDNKTYTLAKVVAGNIDITIGIYEGSKLLGTFRFEDKIKQDSKTVIRSLEGMGISLGIFTGDKKSSAEKVAENLGIPVDIYADLKPEDKAELIKKLKNNDLRFKNNKVNYHKSYNLNPKSHRNIIAMVGDGINDAPALALADVGMVFSNEEQTAASEAADIVFLGGNFSLVITALMAAKRTIGIAKQSIFWGIGLSIGAMIAAAFGLIPPIIGAGLQEAIDVAVIINALRSSR